MSEFFYPKLTSVEALIPYKLLTQWSTGEVLEVDLERVIRKIPTLQKLLSPKVFANI